MLDLKRIAVTDLEPQEFDEPYRIVSGAGVLFGNSGGVAEAALRMALEKLTDVHSNDHIDYTEIRGFDGIKETTIEANGLKVRVAVISGLHNAEHIVERIVAGEDVGYDLVEVMACPGGCISGAGHPVPEKIDSLEKRQNVLIEIDKGSEFRKSQDNPDIKKLYADFLGEANSHLAHELLHTHYHHVTGDSMGHNVLRKSDSAFITRVFEICVCDRCRAKGSQELFLASHQQVKNQKMENFIKVRTIRLKENHPGEGIHVTLDGKVIDASKMDNLYRTIMEDKH
jgi:formate dehydrogenase major subunit